MATKKQNEIIGKANVQREIAKVKALGSRMNDTEDIEAMIILEIAWQTFYGEIEIAYQDMPWGKPREKAMESAEKAIKNVIEA